MIRSTPVVIFKILIMLKVSANNMINMGSEGGTSSPYLKIMCVKCQSGKWVKTDVNLKNVNLHLKNILLTQ